MLESPFRKFMQLESAGGIILLAGAALAMLLKNSPGGSIYDAFLNTPAVIQIGALVIAKPLVLWINDGLMAVFFFLIGMELKREVMIGELSQPSQIALPGIAAIGGMLVPAVLYYLLTKGNPAAVQGWAIPTATDIAFALGVLSLVGPGVPVTLKLFLMTLAIIDDLGAIIIIALFYTDDLSFNSLLVAGGAILALSYMKWRGVQKIAPYMAVGLVLWVAVLKSGVHATLAGVILGFFIPLRATDEDGSQHSPLDRMIHDLHPVVAFGILPLFAFANAGIYLGNMTADAVLSGVPLAVAIGLFVGKQVGVFGFTWLAIRFGLAERPAGTSWGQLYGVAILCGIGFTMSLFIGSLSFEGTDLGYSRPDKLGVIVGSIVSGLVGYALLKWLARSPSAPSGST
jgi:Na+:H+ antiporter, NhaA family